MDHLSAATSSLSVTAYLLSILLRFVIGKWTIQSNAAAAFRLLHTYRLLSGSIGDCFGGRHWHAPHERRTGAMHLCRCTPLVENQSPCKRERRLYYSTPHPLTLSTAASVKVTQLPIIDSPTRYECFGYHGRQAKCGTSAFCFPSPCIRFWGLWSGRSA